MKKIYLIANWKMQLNKSDSVRLAVEVCKSASATNSFCATADKNLEVVLCPSYVHLSNVARKIKNSGIKLGAQNAFYHDKGSYTGEVSPSQLKELEVDYVIIGHSERREYLNETDEDVNRKVKITLENNLVPIICVGETMQEKQDEKADIVIIKQINKALQDIELKDNQKLIIAYEPVWVIGTGKAVDPKEAEHAIEVIKYNLMEHFSEEIIDKHISIVYGGSVNADNINDFLKIDLIEGALVGGASLSADKFIPIIKNIK
ncbi:MAG: triose-phosphate isomerase [Patescibacteria group bacterium]